MDIKYKGTRKSDTKSKKYRVFKCIKKEYGCLLNFLKDIELELQITNNKGDEVEIDKK